MANGSSPSTALHIHPCNGGRSDSTVTLSMEAAIKKWTGPLFSIFNALKYIVPSNVGLATLNYQGSETGLLHGNPVPAWCFLIATWAFFLIVGTLKANAPRRNDIWFHILIRAGLVCGLASIVSSISIFIPRRYSFLPLVMLTAVPVVLAWPILHLAYNWVFDLAKNVFDNFSAKFAYWWGTQESSSEV